MSKSVLCQNLKIFATEIFKVKIGLLFELMNDIFEFIENPSSLRINSQFWPEDPNEKLRHGNIEKYSIESFFKWMQSYHLACGL